MNFERTLILFSATFPFGTGETFLKNEFSVLAENFDRVIIVTNNMSSPLTTPLSSKTIVIRYPYGPTFFSKVSSFINFSHLYKELRFMQRLAIPINKASLSTLFTSYAKTIEVNSFLEKLVAANKIQLTTLTLYSYWMNDMAAGIAMFKYKNKEVRALSRAHGWDVYFERHVPAYLPLRNFIIGNLDAVFCISQDGKNYLDDLTGSKFSPKIKLARLGTYNAAHILSGGSIGSLKLLSCSNIIPLKRIHLIIEALSLIENIDIDWIHFGTGKLDFEVSQFAKSRLTEKSNIRFRFAGQVSNSDLLNYYSTNAIDAFINVSETEGLPVSIMEANSFGIPAIATDVGGVSEIVQDKVNGFLLPVNSSSSDIARSIEALYTLTPYKKAEMRKNAFQIWNKNFNAELNYPTFAKSICSL